MKNIGVIVDNEFFTDARVVNECKIMAEAGLNIQVLCFDFGTSEEVFLHKNITVTKVILNRKVKNILFALNNSIELYTLFWKQQISKFIKNNSIEKLHVHDLYMSKAAYYATKKLKINFNVDLHENYPAAINGYKWMHKFPQKLLIRPAKWKKIEGKYLSYACQIVVLSESFRNDLVKKYSILKKEQFVIYSNVPDINELCNYPINNNILDKKNKFIVFYFGGISERRGIYTTIKAIKELKKEIPEIQLLLIGPVDKSEYTEFSEKINDVEVKDSIIYYKWKDISDLPSYINISDVCISPIIKNDQHESGIANKVFQYMLFERPIIVSNCKPQAQIVNTEECGLVFESENETDLAKQIKNLYNNPKLRQSMGENGKNAVIKSYNTKKIGENLISLYLETKRSIKKINS